MHHLHDVRLRFQVVDEQLRKQTHVSPPSPRLRRTRRSSPFVLAPSEGGETGDRRQETGERSFLQLRDGDAAPALLGRRGGDALHLRVRIEESGDRASQLTGPVSMNEPHDALVAYQRLVQMFLRS